MPSTPDDAAVPTPCHQRMPPRPARAWRHALAALWLLSLSPAAALAAAAALQTTPDTPAITATPATAGTVRLLVQSSPLAGYNFHQAARVFPRLQPGDELVLEREPDNPHDANAVRVRWGDCMLGYVPRSGNALVAWALDRGEPLWARISRLQRHRSPSRRIEFEVYME